MNDDLNNIDGIYLDPSSTGNIFYNVNHGNPLKYQSIIDIYDTVNNDGEVVVQVDETTQLRKLLDSLKDTEAEEYIDIVIEFLRRRLVKVLDNPDMVDSLDKLRELGSLDLTTRISYMESEINRLRASLSDVTTKLDKLLEIFKNGQEEIRYL